MNVNSEILFPKGYEYIVLSCVLLGSFQIISVSLKSINKMLLQKEELDIRLFPFIIINGIFVMNSFGTILHIIKNIKNIKNN